MIAISVSATVRGLAGNCAAKASLGEPVGAEPAAPASLFADLIPRRARSMRDTMCAKKCGRSNGGGRELRPRPEMLLQHSSLLSTRTLFQSTPAAPDQSTDERSDEQCEEEEKEDLRNFSGAGCDSAKAEYRCDDCDREKHDSVVHHFQSFLSKVYRRTRCTDTVTGVSPAAQHEIGTLHPNASGMPAACGQEWLIAKSEAVSPRKNAAFRRGGQGLLTLSC